MFGSDRWLQRLSRGIKRIMVNLSKVFRRVHCKDRTIHGRKRRIVRTANAHVQQCLLVMKSDGLIYRDRLWTITLESDGDCLPFEHVCGADRCGTVSGCGQWIAGIANLWRTGGDIQANWQSILGNAKRNNAMASVANTHPGHFNDGDMLQVGG